MNNAANSMPNFTNNATLSSVFSNESRMSGGDVLADEMHYAVNHDDTHLAELLVL